MRAALIVLILSIASTISAQEAEPGQVQLPLDTYNQLVDAGRAPARVPRPVPAAYAIGTATVTIQVTATDAKASGEVSVDLRIRIFENEWSSVPVLPSGTPVQNATVNGQPVQLVSSPYGLIWGIDKAGSYNMRLVYRVDANRSPAGFALPVPLPEAAATTLTGTLPGTGLDVAVIPAAGVRTTVSGSSTRVTATIPTTSGVQISWRLPSTEGHSLSRARYTGSLAGDAVTWSGELSVELFSDETVTLNLLPRSVTLRDVQVDGNEAPILVEGGSFATHVKGRGRHRVVISFQVPVQTEGGPPRINLTVPQVPVSRFDLTLPGRKEVSVTPKANVSSRVTGGNTVATVFVPMSTSVSLAWAEAVPETVRAEVRSNAAIYHTVHAEEGVLYLQAMLVYEVSRGETNQIKLEVPPAVQVNRIESPSGAVADWRIGAPRGNGLREVNVFLDRMIKGEMLLQVFYDRSLGGSDPIAVPLLRAVEAQRQRGMVALLSSQELTLKPIDDAGTTRVGENQLPAFVRNAVEMTVAHTFKYVDLPSQLTVEAVPPERKQGRFDAKVDTLITLEELTLRGSASVEVNVKSGGIMELELGLPNGVTVDSLTGPSLRTYNVEEVDGAQSITAHFTQELEGQFRLEVGYERILADAVPEPEPEPEQAAEAEDAAVAEADLGAGDDGGSQGAEVEVPTLIVHGAEVAQGRLAVEAKTAVEVQAVVETELTPQNTNDLPQQLLMRTTNPILLAFKYAQARPHRLVLRITRHQEVEVKEAMIDEAHYRTTFTSDGLAVTEAELLVRNSRNQFLRMQLPRGSEVWKVFVDGKEEKPAKGDDDPDTVLIKIITSTRGFKVQMTYATMSAPIRVIGTIRARLPRPDILVTNSTWDVFLPGDMSYGRVSTNMKLVRSGQPAPMPAIGNEQQAQSAVSQVEPLRIEIPTDGEPYTFKKSFANQGQKDAQFSIPYASSGGARLGNLLCGAWTLLFWFGVVFALRPHRRISRRTGILCLIAGALLLILTIGFYHVSFTSFLLTTLVLALIAIAVRVVQHLIASGTIIPPKLPGPWGAPPAPSESEPEPEPEPVPSVAEEPGSDQAEVTSDQDESEVADEEADEEATEEADEEATETEEAEGSAAEDSAAEDEEPDSEAKPAKGE